MSAKNSAVNYKSFSPNRVSLIIHHVSFIGIYFAICLILLSLFSCGGSTNPISDKGSITFNLEWENPAKISKSQTSPDVCVDYGITTVSATVYNSSNVNLASGSWPCSYHSGTIYNVPAGSNMRIQLEGSVSNVVSWRGEKTDITVSAEKNTNAGTITMTYIGNDTTRPTVTSVTPFSNSINIPVTTALTAIFSEKIASSSINTSTFTLKAGTNSVIGSVTYNTDVKTAIFIPSTNLNYSTTYTATITTGVEDMAGNHMANNYTWSFTTNPLPGTVPLSPTGVNVTSGDKLVAISWNAVSDTTSYNIYWSTTSGVTKTTGTKISNVTSPYLHTNLTNGIIYYYVVTAENNYGESSESNEVSATPQAIGTAPSPPAGVTATAGDKQVTVSWNSVNGATSYNIYWSATSGVTKTTGTRISGITSPYTHAGLTNGTTYFYILTALNSYGESSKSNEVSATPKAPGGITELKPMNEARGNFGTAKGADGKIYVFGGGGGTYPPGVISSVECYDPNTDTWAYKQSLPTARAWQRAATAQDGKIYLFGGSNNSWPSTDVWAYDPVTNTWDTSIPRMPGEERDTVAVTGTDGIIYLFGGYWNYNTVQAFNPSTKTWQIKSPMPTGRWAAAGALGPDGKIYIVGGGYPGQPDYGVYNTLEVYDPVTDSWETKSPMPTARNYLGAAFGGDGKLYVVGGEVYGAGRTGIVYDVIEAYDPLTDTWETAGHLPLKLTQLSGSVVADNLGNIHCLGGNTLSEVKNTHYLLTP